MIDFLLNESGDIVLEETSTIINSSRIFFSTFKETPIRISFFTQEGDKTTKGKDGISIGFTTKRIEESFSAKMVSGKDAISQKVLCSLKTELGDLKHRKEFGSELYKHRHKKLHERQSLIDVEATANKTLDKYLPNSEIKVSPVIRKEFSYEQCMHINIKNKKIGEINYVF